MELPVPFTTYICALLGNEQAEKLFASLEEEQPVSIRINEAKLPHYVDSAAHSQLSTLHSSLNCVPWSASGYYLDERLTFTFDPLFHAGCYYVQEASSMFVEQALKQYAGSQPAVMLDLCAAPGGKSTHACSVLPEGSLLVANEVIRNRSQILAENLTKWGYPDVVVTNNDPADFSPLEDFFDVILTDVPCSGEGMFRKDPVAVSEWSAENVEICWQRQRRILRDVWSCLKPGGILIYSTCTYNTKEDEENIRWIRDEYNAEVLPLDVPMDWNVTGNLLAGEDFPVYRFLPHKTRGEGFFLAVLRKPLLGTASLKVNSSSVKVSFSDVKVTFSDANLNSTSATLVAEKNKFVGTRNTLTGKPNKFAGKPNNLRGKGTATPGISKEQLSALRGWLLASDNYELILNGNSVSAFPRAYLQELSALQASLRIVQAGVGLAELKGRDWIPNHALSMSLALNTDAFPCEEVTYQQAIAYLRKEAVTLQDAASRGVILLTYKHIPIGFVKNIGNRANNLYPQEWRIRSGYLPEEIKMLRISLASLL